MDALTFIPYEPPVSRSKNPSTEGFRPIDDFTKPVKSASRPTSRPVNQQRDETASKKYGRDFPAVFKDPYRDLPKDTVEWIRNRPLSDCTDYVEGKDDGSSRAQNRGDCQDDPFVIKDDCNDATSRCSMRDTTHSQFSPIDPVTLIESNTTTASDPSSGWDRGVQDHDLIECLDMTDLPPKEPLDLSHEPTPDLNGAEVHAGEPSNELHTQGSYGHGGREEEDELPSLEELLGFRGGQGSQRGGSSGEHRTGRSDGVFECSAEPDYNSAPTPGLRRHGNDCRDLDSCSRFHTSNSSTSEEQGGTQGSLSTLPTSVAGSEAGYPALSEKKDDPISDLPSSPGNILLSSTHGEVNDEVTCESSSGDCRGMESVHSAGEDEEDEVKGDEWEDEKAEADEGVVPDRDGNKNKTSLQSSTKKRGRSTTDERPSSQRRSKRYRFSSPLSSTDETESDDESVISRYTPSKPYHVSTPRPTSSRLSTSESDVSNGKTTVIYERQSWAGEIIDERDVKQGRGRPRKQYLIRWESSWVDGGRLTAPELLQNWRGKEGSKCRR